MPSSTNDGPGRGPFFSVFIRSLGIIALTTGVVAAAVSIQADKTSRTIAEDGVRLLAAEVTTLLADRIGGAVRFRKTQDVEATVGDLMTKDGSKLVSLVVVDAEGQVISEFGSAAPEDTQQLRSLASAATETHQATATGNGFWVAMPVHYGPENEVIGALATIWTPEVFLNTIAAARRRQIIVAGGLFAVLCFFAALYLRHSLSNPLNAMTKRTLSLAEGDLESAVPGLKRRDEIGSTAVALENLREQLSDAALITKDAIFQGAAFQASTDAMILTDIDLKITHSNQALSTLVGAQTRALQHLVPGCSEVSISGHVVDLKRVGLPDSSALPGAKELPVSTDFQFEDQLFAASVNRIPDTSGACVGYVIEVSDVTVRRKAAALLQSLESDQLRADFDADGKLRNANAGFSEALGLARGDSDDLTISGLLTDENGADPMVTLARGRAYVGRMRATTHRRERLFDGSVNPVSDRNGRSIGFILIARDISDAQKALDAAESEKERLEGGRTKVVEILRKAMTELSEGNLRIRIEDDVPEEYEPLRRDFNAAVERLEEAVGLVYDNSASILSEADDIAGAADNLSRRTEQQAATLEEFAAALTQMTASVGSAAERADSANTVVTNARESAEASGEVVQQAVEAMGEISSSSDQISRIIGVIDEIAFQTNLLALNAGVEAARAGDAGRGFAVVASEVRALAQRSSEAAREINDLISASGAQVKRGVALVDNAGEALRKIVGSVTDIANHVSEIAASAREQSSGLEEINGAMGQLDQVTQQNAAMFEETTAATHTLTGEANALVDATRRFETSRSVEANANAARRKGRDDGRSGLRDKSDAAPSRHKHHATESRTHERPTDYKPKSKWQANGNAALAAREDDWEDF